MPSSHISWSAGGGLGLTVDPVLGSLSCLWTSLFSQSVSKGSANCVTRSTVTPLRCVRRFRSTEGCSHPIAHRSVRYNEGDGDQHDTVIMRSCVRTLHAMQRRSSSALRHAYHHRAYEAYIVPPSNDSAIAGLLLSGKQRPTKRISERERRWKGNV